MKVLAENYKGIEFIRISKLPAEQKAQITQALPADHVIRILRENELLTDCIQFKHYEAWYNQQYQQTQIVTQTTTALEKAIPKIEVN